MGALLLMTLWAGLIATPGQAAFMGDPNPDAKRFGFHHSLVFDRGERDITSSRWNSPITLESQSMVARESYGLTGWRDILITLYGQFGINRTRVDFGAVTISQQFWQTYAPDTVSNGATRGLQFGNSYGPQFGAGAKLRLFDIWGVTLGGGAQVNYTTSNDTRQPALKLRYNEWDVYGGLSWKRRFLGLYTGMNLSWLVGEMLTPDPNVATDLDQNALVGVYAGLSMHFYRHLDLTTEFRMINQSSLSAQLKYNF